MSFSVWKTACEQQRACSQASLEKAAQSETYKSQAVSQVHYSVEVINVLV